MGEGSKTKSKKKNEKKNYRLAKRVTMTKAVVPASRSYSRRHI